MTAWPFRRAVVWSRHPSRAAEVSLLEEREDGFWRRRRAFLLGGALALVLALAGCGSGGGKNVATVSSTPISQKQLDSLVDHFRKEAEAEGRSFPKQGTDAYRVQRHRSTPRPGVLDDDLVPAPA